MATGRDVRFGNKDFERDMKMKYGSLTLLLSLCLMAIGCPENASDSSSDTDPADAADIASGDTTDSATEDGIGDSGQDASTDCTVTCEETFTCTDGKVFYQPGGTADCAEGCGLGTLRAECDEGCREGISVEPILHGENAHQMCVEHEFRRLWDPCTQDSHCEPTSGQSLACDENIRRCVDVDEPEYLTSCGLDATTVENGKGYIDAAGADAPGCETLPYCLVERDSLVVCTGCTRTCESDQDCPATSECRAVDASSGGGESLKLCVYADRFAPDCEVL